MFRIDRTLVNIEPMKANITDRAQKDSALKREPEEKPDAESEKKHADYANGIITHATQQAQELLQAAEEQALLIKRIARQKGYEEGMSEAALKLEKALDEIRKEDRTMAENVVYKFEQARMEMLGDMEEEIIELSLAIVRKVFGKSSSNDSTMLESMILNALKQMQKEGMAIVRVSKEEYDRFFSSGGASFVPESRNISVVPDDGLNCGDCLIESDGETINAGFDCQLRNIQAAFKGAGGVSV